MLTVQVVGSGCANCRKLESMCREILTEQGIEASVEKVTDINRFAELGIFMTPGLLLNGEVVSSGKMPTRQTLEHWIRDAAVAG